jgi:hypothetical protein
MRAVRPARWWAAVVLAVGLAPLVCAGPAAAADGTDGFWWYDAMGVAQVQADGVTGAGVKVAVIDNAIDPQVPMLVGANVKVNEPGFCRADAGEGPLLPTTGTALTNSTWHGSNVTALISGTGKGYGGARSTAGIAPGAAVTFYSIDDPAVDTRTSNPCTTGSGQNLSFERAITTAVDDGARIISISQFAPSTVISPATKQVYAWALHQGVVLVIGLGDYTTDPDALALMNGVVAVQGGDANGAPMGTGTTAGVVPHQRVTVLAPGVNIFQQGDPRTKSWQASIPDGGTSYATPLVAGMLADVAGKYPKATGNQLIQSLIHNTDKDDHPLAYDPAAGYGTANLRHMLAVDPTKYPDVNPLIVQDAPAKWDNSAGEIASAQWPDSLALAGQPSPKPSATVHPSATPAPSGSQVPAGRAAGLPGWVWPVAAGAVLVLVLTVVLGLVLARGANRRRAGPPGGPA